MIPSILALALAYVFLLFVLVLAVLRSDIRPGLKFAAVGACFAFYLWHYGALEAYLGWPARDELPDNFELVSVVTVEPDMQRGESGSIYLWVRDLDSDQPIPRSYRLAYDKRVHQQADDTLRRQRLGERFVGRPRAGGGDRPPVEFEKVERSAETPKSAVN